jgi:RNA polymerase sigma-70 factor (ECF subfamily)
MTEADVKASVWDDSTSSSLLVRVKAKSPSAWARLVTLYGGLIYQWCRRAGLQPADAEDVGQEVLEALHRSIQEYRHDRPEDTFRGWLRTITQNKIRDWARRRKREHAMRGVLHALWRPRERIPELSEPNPAAAAAEQGFIYLQALKVLQEEFEERTWQAFWQVAVDGIPPADVATTLSMTRNAVYLAKSHVLRRLKEEFFGSIGYP